MWILAAEDRLYWLLPGRTYVVGRILQKNGEQVDIPVHSDASVSRKHLSLLVPLPPPGSVLHPSIRSELVVTDLNSRYGTVVDTKTLPNGESQLVPQVPNGMLSVRMGREPKRLRLKWVLHVVTYLTGQQDEAHRTLFDYAAEISQQCDFKITNHLVASTAVLVVTGKSTSSLFYALAKQIPVVNTQYFEALRDHAQSVSTRGTTDRSFLPSLEPFYADPLYRPNAHRQQVLRGVKLVIKDAKYAAVMAPIVQAAGGQVCDTANLNLVALADDLPSGTHYVLGSTVFSLIYSARAMQSSDVIVKKGKTKRKNLLEIMTSPATPVEAPPPPHLPPKRLKLEDKPNLEALNEETNEETNKAPNQEEELFVDSQPQTSPKLSIYSEDSERETSQNPQFQVAPPLNSEPLLTKSLSTPLAENLSSEELAKLVRISNDVLISRTKPSTISRPSLATNGVNFKGFRPKQTPDMPRSAKISFTEYVEPHSPKRPRRAKLTKPTTFRKNDFGTDALAGELENDEFAFSFS